MKPRPRTLEIADALHGRLGTLSSYFLATASLFCFATFLYYFYYYNWSGVRQFTGWSGIVLDELLPVVGGIVLMGSLYLAPSRRMQIALTVGAAGLSLYMAEFAMAIASSAVPVDLERSMLYYQSRENQATKKETAQIAAAQGITFDQRDRLQVIEGLEKQNITAMPTLSPAFLFKKVEGNVTRSKITINGQETMPLSGVSSQVTVFCNENGDYLIYKSDERGFHNPPGSWQDGPLDIVAVGDSFTHGACVPSDKNFVALIRKNYPRTLDLGIQGYGPLAELATLKEYARPLKPKVVLWFYYENDLNDLLLEERSPLLSRYVTDDRFTQNLMQQQSEIDRALVDYVASQRNARVLANLKTVTSPRMTVHDAVSGIEQFVKLAHLRQRLNIVGGVDKTASDESTSEKNLSLFERVLNEANKSVNGWGGRLVFVYLPSWYDYSTHTANDRGRSRVLALAKGAGLTVIDLDPNFRSGGDPLGLFPFRRYGHYNEAGNRLVADTVLRELSIEKK